MQLMVSEILEQASKIDSKKQKIEFLRKNYNKTLHFILEHVFNPNVKFLLPETDPLYTPMPTGEGQGMLYSEARKMYLFLEGGRDDLPQFRRELLFVQFLESIDPKDAELILHVKNKKLPYKGITEKLIREAFGDYKNE
jgi:hypothetical protein